MEAALTTSLDAQGLDVLGSLARIGVSLQHSAHEGRAADLPALLEQRQACLQALHALVQKGLRLDEGAIARQWGGILKQDEATERAMTEAMDRLAASLKRARQRRRTTSAYKPAGPRPVRYCDLHG